MTAQCVRTYCADGEWGAQFNVKGGLEDSFTVHASGSASATSNASVGTPTPTAASICTIDADMILICGEGSLTTDKDIRGCFARQQNAECEHYMF